MYISRRIWENIVYQKYENKINNIVFNNKILMLKNNFLRSINQNTNKKVYMWI
jgi:hypothetical protein